MQRTCWTMLLWDLPKCSAPEVRKGPRDLAGLRASQKRPHNEQEKRAKILIRKPRGTLKDPTHPSPSVLQPHCHLLSHKAFKPWGAGLLFSEGTTWPGQESIPLSGAEEVAQPCKAGGDVGFYSYCSLRRPSRGEAGAGRRLESLASWGRTRGLPSSPVPASSLPCPGCPQPDLQCAGSPQGSGAWPALMPVTCCQLWFAW